MTDQKIAEYLLNLLEVDGGTVAKTDVADKLPFLSDVEVARIFAEYAPDVHETTVAGIPCWQRSNLPANFAAHLKETLANLEEMGFKVSPDNINLALSLHSGSNFCKTHGLDTEGFHALLKGYGICPKRIVPTELVDLKDKYFTASKWKTYVKGWHNPKRKEVVNLYKSGMPFHKIVNEVDMLPKDVSWLLWIDKNMPLVLMKNDLMESDIAGESA